MPLAALSVHRRCPNRGSILITHAHLLASSNAGVRLRDAAAHLGVSITALKRACRRLGIPKWGRDIVHAPLWPKWGGDIVHQPIHTPFPFPCGHGTIDDVLAPLWLSEFI